MPMYLPTPRSGLWKRGLLTLGLLGGPLVAQVASSPAPAPTPAPAATQAPATTPAPTPAPDTRTVTLDLAGDTMLGSSYPEGNLPPKDGAAVLSEVAPILKQADFAFVNLEGVLYDGARLRAMGSNSWRYIMPTHYAQYLVDAGLDVICSANNHANDAEADGLSSTVATVQAAGLASVGTPLSPDAVLTSPNGIKVGWIAFAPHMGTLGFDIEDMQHRVADLKTRADLVVVSMHAGAEGLAARHVPRKTEIYLGANRGDVYAFAHAAVEAGADLVVGHGPHVLRAMELYRGKLIAYSLGNFATYGRFNLRGVSGLGVILQVTLKADGTLAGGKLISTRQDKGSAAWSEGIAVEPDETQGALREIQALSAEDFPESSLGFSNDGDLILHDKHPSQAPHLKPRPAHQSHRKHHP